MKKLKKLSLHAIDRQAIEKTQQNKIRGGYSSCLGCHCYNYDANAEEVMAHQEGVEAN